MSWKYAVVELIVYVAILVVCLTSLIQTDWYGKTNIVFVRTRFDLKKFGITHVIFLQLCSRIETWERWYLTISNGTSVGSRPEISGSTVSLIYLLYIWCCWRHDSIFFLLLLMLWFHFLSSFVDVMTPFSFSFCWRCDSISACIVLVTLHSPDEFSNLRHCASSTIHTQKTQ